MLAFVAYKLHIVTMAQRDKTSLESEHDESHDS